MLIFIPWDIAFTYYGIWGYNEKYICGIYLLYLPIEEWLFFPVTLYACVFIYECLNSYIQTDLLRKIYMPILILIALTGITVSVLKPLQLYSSMKIGGASILILLCLFVFRSKFLSRFLLAYLVSLLPFFIMNAILTGSFIEEEIVWYHPSHIFNFRLFTIPVEDLFYCLFMMLLTVLFYDALQRKTNEATVNKR